jgi:hypothetical protein
MKGINSTGALLVHVPGWVGGWVGVKAVLRFAYSNQKLLEFFKNFSLLFKHMKFNIKTFQLYMG